MEPPRNGLVWDPVEKRWKLDPNVRKQWLQGASAPQPPDRAPVAAGQEYTGPPEPPPPAWQGPPVPMQQPSPARMQTPNTAVPGFLEHLYRKSGLKSVADIMASQIPGGRPPPDPIQLPETPYPLGNPSQVQEFQQPGLPVGIQGQGFEPGGNPSAPPVYPDMGPTRELGPQFRGFPRSGGWAPTPPPPVSPQIPSKSPPNPTAVPPAGPQQALSSSGGGATVPAGAPSSFTRMPPAAPPVTRAQVAEQFRAENPPMPQWQGPPAPPAQGSRISVSPPAAVAPEEARAPTESTSSRFMREMGRATAGLGRNFTTGAAIRAGVPDLLKGGVSNQEDYFTPEERDFWAKKGIRIPGSATRSQFSKTLPLMAATYAREGLYGSRDEELELRRRGLDLRERSLDLTEQGQRNVQGRFDKNYWAKLWSQSRIPPGEAKMAEANLKSLGLIGWFKQHPERAEAVIGPVMGRWNAIKNKLGLGTAESAAAEQELIAYASSYLTAATGAQRGMQEVAWLLKAMPQMSQNSTQFWSQINVNEEQLLRDLKIQREWLQKQRHDTSPITGTMRMIGYDVEDDPFISPEDFHNKVEGQAPQSPTAPAAPAAPTAAPTASGERVKVVNEKTGQTGSIKAGTNPPEGWTIVQ